MRTVDERPYRPAEQRPVQDEAERPVAAPYVPAAQRFCVAEGDPAAHQ